MSNVFEQKQPMDKEEWLKHVEQMEKQATVALHDLCAELEKQIESTDAVRLFIAVVANTCFGPAGSISEITHGDVPAKIETLAYYAYPHFGISTGEITPWTINQCIDTLDKLVMMRMIVPKLKTNNGKEDALERIITIVRQHAEIVRGSAFPEQTSEEIKSVQGQFEKWFKNIVKIGPERVQAILWSIIKTQEKQINSIMPLIREKARKAGEEWQTIKHKKDRNPEENMILDTFKSRQAASVFEYMSRINELAEEFIPVAFEDIIGLETLPSQEECEALIQLIGMNPEKRKTMSDIIEMRRRPLFVLPDGRVILVDISNALDNLWSSYEKIAKTDTHFYHGTYQKKRSKWLQTKIVDYMSRLFPASQIFQNLTYPNPDKGDDAIAELDVAISWGPFLILLEAKAAQFRLEGQLGDIARLRTDIKANVEDAFEQASRAARYINQTEHPEFIEPSTGRHLTIQKNKVYRTYLLTVSQHHLEGLATRLSMFEDIGLFTDKEYPLSISIADLDVVTNFCDGADVFLHYIEKRLAIQKENLNILADELVFFGAYLQTRLQADRLWNQKEIDPRSIALVGFSAKFDDWFSYKRGDLEVQPEIKLEIPIEVKQILEELRNRDDFASRWISFTLLDMSDKMLNEIANCLKDIKNAKLTRGMFRRCTFSEKKIAVSIVASFDLPPSLLEERTKMRTIIEKYRRKAEKSIGIGIIVNDDTRPFHSITWTEGTWEYDAELEKLVKEEPPFIPASGTKLPGRNDPCICGSGKKFKKCCLSKIQLARKNMK
jgi:hypothetical protein